MLKGVDISANSAKVSMLNVEINHSTIRKRLSTEGGRVGSLPGKREKNDG